MSHHFDTPTAREDPRINVCDFYLFNGSPGATVMAMTVNPDAGVSAPETFRDEGLYAFRFDLNGDAREELAFKVRLARLNTPPATSAIISNPSKSCARSARTRSKGSKANSSPRA